jgi:2-oxoglutarate dehydrogenase E1 component
VSHDVNVNGNKIRLTIVPNPSHLETVNPVVMGTVRAIQDRENDFKREKTLGVIIHGDAALAGQGIVYETLQM